MKYIRTKNSHRGQLQIAETLVSVSLMLVLAVFLINAANQAIPTYSNLENLDRVASDILSISDEAGLLRPVVYLHDNENYNSEYETYLDSLNTFISTIISENIGYALIAHNLVNGTPDQIYFTLIGSPAEIQALQNGGKGTVTNYYLGSFASASYGLYYTQYLVRLYLWEKI
ncbi:MAG: hypothetical protein ACW964_08945 [Candidatus Hodarchaeales archaeon]|jgi:hypothetical protein